MILSPDSSSVHSVAQIPESTSHQQQQQQQQQYTDISSITHGQQQQRDPSLNLGRINEKKNLRC